MTSDPTPRPDGDHRLTMLHGFTQTGACFGPLAEALALHHRVLTPDLPGHGTESRAAGLDCSGAADELAERCGRGDWLGYSLGGRIALHVALRHPEAVERLVLLSTTAGIDDPAKRAARTAQDRQRADHVEALGVQRFLAEWLTMDMFSALEPWARFAEERARNTSAGLAGSLRNCGTGSMAPLWARLAELRMPVLVLAGSLDETYVEAARRMATAIGAQAQVEIVPGAHHAVHLEDPATVTRIVESFLG